MRFGVSCILCISSSLLGHDTLLLWCIFEYICGAVNGVSCPALSFVVPVLLEDEYWTSDYDCAAVIHWIYGGSHCGVYLLSNPDEDV
jgi:hypothetical protein